MNEKRVLAEPMAKTNTTNLGPQDNEHQLGELQTHDAVFGEITEYGPNYRNVCGACRHVFADFCGRIP